MRKVRRVSTAEMRRRRAAKAAEPSSAKYVTGRKGVADARRCFATCAKEDMYVNQKQKKLKGSIRQNGMRNGGKKREKS